MEYQVLNKDLFHYPKWNCAIKTIVQVCKVPTFNSSSLSASTARYGTDNSLFLDKVFIGFCKLFILVSMVAEWDVRYLTKVSSKNWHGSSINKGSVSVRIWRTIV